MENQFIYLDYNATTPIAPQVAEAMLPYLYEKFGNPSSNHPFGKEARNAVEHARQQVAEMLGCGDEEIIFTSGGTESNNLALKGVAYANREKGNHIITTTIEHPAILEVCASLGMEGFRVSLVKVDGFGRIDPSLIQEAARPETILISVMHANNEVGTIQPIREIAKIAHSHDIWVHTDAAQSIGKIPVSVEDLGVDLLSLAGHKLYAPKGIGVLYIRRGTRLEKIIHGAAQENDLRAGTENVLEIVGLGKACELVANNLEDDAKHMRTMRDLLASEMKAVFPQVVINGHPEHCLPNTLSISFPDLAADQILASLQGVAASAGAACHARDVAVSHVLKALGIPEAIAMGTIRLSVGRYTTAEEIRRAVQAFQTAIHQIQNKH